MCQMMPLLHPHLPSKKAASTKSFKVNSPNLTTVRHLLTWICFSKHWWLLMISSPRPWKYHDSIWSRTFPLLMQFQLPIQYYLFSRFHPIFHECHSWGITIIFLSRHISNRFWNEWEHSMFETTFNCIYHWGYIPFPLQLFDKIRIIFTGLCSLKSSTCFVINTAGTICNILHDYNLCNFANF